MSIIQRLKRELNFLLVQKYAVFASKDKFTIGKGSFKKFLPKNPVIIDCGAHNGTDSVELSKVFPKAKIHSFEPVPAIFDQLLTKTKEIKNITCYQLALSNEDSTANMFISSVGSDGSSSLLQPETHLQDHPNVLFEETLQVNTYKLDTWADQYHVNHVDLLWLDMQGFEYQTLVASPRILATVKVIHTEISVKETYKGVITYPEFKKWLETQNFQMVKEAIPEGTDMGNAVFVKKELL